MMITILTLDEDSQTRRDGELLEKINLTNAEWNAITNLLKILEPFAEATDILGGSKYATIRFMYV